MTSRFLIAKYAPDLRRMEPRNIGVIVWAGGQLDSLFLGEDHESREFVGVPRRVGIADKDNYRNWIVSWRRQLSKPSLELRGGAVVSRKSPEFIDGLREWSKANYMLVDGGVADAAKSDNALRAITLQLFRDLVAEDVDATRPENEHRQLKVKATELWKELGVWEGRPDFRKDQPVTFKLYGEKKPFVFDYAFGPSETPHSVCQRVVLGHQPTFDSVLMNLEHYRQFRQLDKDRCAAMILPTEAADSKLVAANKRILGHVANIIDLNRFREAARKASSVAAMNGHS